MVICTAGLEFVPMLHEPFCECSSVGDDLLGISPEGGMCDLEEGGGNTGDGLRGYVSFAKNMSLRHGRCYEVHPGRQGRRHH